MKHSELKDPLGYGGGFEKVTDNVVPAVDHVASPALPITDLRDLEMIARDEEPMLVAAEGPLFGKIDKVTYFETPNVFTPDIYVDIAEPESERKMIYQYTPQFTEDGLWMVADAECSICARQDVDARVGDHCGIRLDSGRQCSGVFVQPMTAKSTYAPGFDEVSGNFTSDGRWTVGDAEAWQRLKIAGNWKDD